jgi:hypothetical protein
MATEFRFFRSRNTHSRAAMKAQHVFENEPDVDGLRVVRALSGAVAGSGSPAVGRPLRERQG